MTNEVIRDKKYQLSIKQIKEILKKDVDTKEVDMQNTLQGKFKGSKYMFSIQKLKDHYNLTEKEFNEAYDTMRDIYANRGSKTKKTLNDKAKLNKKNSAKESANSINLKAQITVLAEDIQDKQNKLLALVAKLNK